MNYNDPDPYNILGIHPGASLDEIKKAYRKLVQKWHPDVCGKTMANIKRFLAIKDAYILLKEKYKKSIHIEGTSNKRRPPATYSNRSQLTEGAFCFVQIPIEKALKGTKVILEVNDGEDFCPECSGLGTISRGAKRPCKRCKGRGYRIMPWGGNELKVICQSCSGKGFQDINTCPKCKGKGFLKQSRIVQITIPPGTRDGTIIKLPGEGPFDPEKNLRSSLFVEVEVLNPKNWIIHGKDIISTLDIDCWTHLGGGYVTVETIDGPIKLFITPGQKSEKFIRIKNKGWVDRKGKRGDMLLRLNILYPSGLCTKEALELIDKLKRLWPCKNTIPKALPFLDPSLSKGKKLTPDK